VRSGQALHPGEVVEMPQMLHDEKVLLLSESEHGSVQSDVSSSRDLTPPLRSGTFMVGITCC
jgi:hypothetical protein